MDQCRWRIAFLLRCLLHSTARAINAQAPSCLAQLSAESIFRLERGVKMHLFFQTAGRATGLGMSLMSEPVRISMHLLEMVGNVPSGSTEIAAGSSNH